MTRRTLLVGISLALAACTAHMGEDETTGDSFTEVEAELDRHHGSVMAGTSLTTVVDESSMHVSNMHRIMGGMVDSMSDMMSRGMMHCSRATMGEMNDTMAGMQLEMRDHTDALVNAVDLDSARALCETHVEAMRAMVSRMRGALGGSGCGMMA